MALSAWERLLAGPLSGRSLSVLLHQMAVMQSNGISLSDILLSLEVQQEHPVLREILRDVGVKVSTGWTLSSALEAHPKVFGSETVMLIRAGESTGDLTGRLRKAADLEERRCKLVSEVRQALTSPAITLAAGLVVLLGVTNLVMPRFLVLYEQLNVPLPWISRLVIGLVRVLNHPLTWISLLGLLVAGVKYRHQVRRQLYTLALCLPVVRDWLGIVLCAQFCDILGSLHREGVPLQKILANVAASTDNPIYREHLERVEAALREGGSLAKAIRKVPYFPPLAYAVCMVGEESGGLDVMLSSLTRLLEAQIDMVLVGFANLIEPVIILGLGTVLGVFFVGMFLPIYGILNSLGS